jgi:hypothetical protein
MELTMELAATAGQVIPVFAVGSLVAYTARVRSHNAYLNPFMAALTELDAKVIEWDSAGLSGFELIRRGHAFLRERLGVNYQLDSSVWQTRLLAILAYSVVLLANVIAFCVCLLRLFGWTMPPFTSYFVILSTAAGLLATALVPMLARSKGVGSAYTNRQTPLAVKAREISQRARAEMTDVERMREKAFKEGLVDPRSDEPPSRSR